jgi:selenocysteine-specific elongation factor
VPVDAIEGHGIDDLNAALDHLLNVTPTARDDKKPRLWIDRVFAAKGAGTVVTGTLTGGMVRVEDELSVLPQHTAVRVRALQSQYADRTKVGPGNRVAATSSAAVTCSCGLTIGMSPARSTPVCECWNRSTGR